MPQCVHIHVCSIVASDEVQGKAKKVKDGLGETVTAATGKLHDDMDHMKDGVDKSLHDEVAADV